MSERIFVSSNPRSVPDQLASATDIRYSGVLAKPRFHPRLIIRKFRRTNLTSATSLGNNETLVFDNFILTDAEEEVEEKYQIVQTFGPDFVFMYGPKPRIFTYSGVLYNTVEKPWVTEWQRAWDRSVPTIGTEPDGFQRGILSGTNVLLQGGVARLEFDGSTDPGTGASTASAWREGYILKFSVKRSGDRPNAASFQLIMIVTSRLD